ncbi:unnamed protein product [Chondrus crispus]|uniref:Uncharacterized protein n=1 Tax=Chondrus crispus TaxID=2769 RepID=R7QBS1_CHOCR|nr:unnamed protein product [Chondrus crispus]CDF34915.1 unnamed protein product [Chondrus crispus]|eukprot:XP_005714734.1 unnamed protein product [Chondrus crispus]
MPPPASTARAKAEEPQAAKLYTRRGKLSSFVPYPWVPYMPTTHTVPYCNCTRVRERERILFRLRPNHPDFLRLQRRRNLILQCSTALYQGYCTLGTSQP